MAEGVARAVAGEAARRVFVAGATGYVGIRLCSLLSGKGLDVTALVRDSSRRKLPAGVTAVEGDALSADTFRDGALLHDTFVQLVGVSHPSPAKAMQFRQVDLVSCQQSVAVAKSAGVQHFVYVSVAHPAPVMKAYIEVRMQCEEMIRESGMNATILRPWYILGPGHYWPYAILPVYWMLERIPSYRESAIRLKPIALGRFLRALVWAVENPATGVRVLDVPAMMNL